MVEVDDWPSYLQYQCLGIFLSWEKCITSDAFVKDLDKHVVHETEN